MRDVFTIFSRKFSALGAKSGLMNVTNNNPELFDNLSSSIKNLRSDNAKGYQRLEKDLGNLV